MGSFTMKATGVGLVDEQPIARAAPPPRRIREGSSQQEAFWTHVVGGSGHALLEARAGTGKSSSCREAMHRLAAAGSPAVRYCCFNKKVADEFREGCPAGVDVGTMHSFGLAALRRAFGSEVQGDKTYLALDALPEGPDLPRYLRKSVSSLVSLAKNTLAEVDPEAPGLDELVAWYDVPTFHQTPRVVEAARAVLAASREMTSIVDFDDMLWLPVVHGLGFPGLDFLFVDECQDLNPVQHALVALLNPSGRTIIVGDPYQSIYAFRGADSESIPKLRSQLGAATMPLTVSWRCPRSHVELAKRLVEDFEAAPGAIEGEVDSGDLGALDGAGPGALVLCRSNAPLISGCLRMVRERRRAIVRGRAFGKELLSVIQKLDARTVDDVLIGVRRWHAREVDRLSRKDGTEHLVEVVRDKALCLEAIAETCGSPAEIPDLIGSLFSDQDSAGRVTFSSVHRAKGSEARDVYLIQVPYSQQNDRLRPPAPWELEQRRNLRYVALTRSMDRLTFIDPTRA